MKTQRRRGFTVVELVVVIAIIAVLAAVLIPTFASIIKKANESAYLQERTNQQIADLAEKVEKINYFTWEDFEKKLAEELAKVGSTDTEAIQKAVDAAIAKYSDSSQTGNTGLTETQVKKIVEEAMKGQLTTAQVEAIVRQVLSGTTVSEETIRTIVNNAVKGMSTTGVTKAQVAEAVKAAISGTIAVNDAQLEAAVTKALEAFGVSTITDQEVEAIVSNLKNVITINEEPGFSTGVYTIASDKADKVYYLVTDAALDSFTITGSTEATTIIIDAPNIKNVTINGDAKVLRVLRTADESTHIKGKVTTLEVNSGRVVIEANATVDTIKAAPAKQATVTIVLENGSKVTDLNSEFQYYAGTNDYIKIIDNGATIENSFITSSSAVTTSTTTNVVLSGSAFVDEDNNPTVENKSSVSADIKVNDTTYTSDGETSDLMLFAGGTGTEADPYLIATAAQWNNFYQTVYDANLAGKTPYFELEKDIDLSGVNIKNYAIKENGDILYGYYMSFVLDGRGFEIKSIESFEGYCQLLPYPKNATIKNITINFNLVNKTSTAAMSYSAYGNVYFTDVTTTGQIKTSANWATAFVAYPQASNVYYTNCTNRANLTTNFTSNSYVAPFGSHDGANGANIYFDNCQNFGNIAGGHVGGFVGMGNNDHFNFKDENAVKNYGSLTYSSDYGYFQINNTSDTFKTNNTNVTCTVKQSGSSNQKLATLSVNNPSNGEKLVINNIEGATKYVVTVSSAVQVYNYDNGGNANRWSGGFPRSMVGEYVAESGATTETAFINVPLKENRGTKLNYQTDEEVDYNGLFVDEQFDINSNNVTVLLGDPEKDPFVLVSYKGEVFYYFMNSEYTGLVPDGATSITLTFSVTAYNGDIVLGALSSYSYTYSLGE